MYKFIILFLIFVVTLFANAPISKLSKKYDKTVYAGHFTCNVEQSGLQEKAHSVITSLQKYAPLYEKYHIEIIGDTSCGPSYEKYASDFEDALLDYGIKLKNISTAYFRLKNRPAECSRSRSVDIYLHFKDKKVFDGDSDGVEDSIDKCPNTPLGAKVSADGCVHKTAVVLLPGKKKHSAVVVKTEDASVVVDKPLELVELQSDAKITPPRVITPKELEKLAGSVIHSAPKKQLHYVLYFKKERMLEKSKKTLQTMLDELKNFPNPYIKIVGHTDTFGSEEDNEVLGLKRATLVADAIKKAGIKYIKLKVLSASEKELAVQTPDETSEPKNRRVEVFVQ